MNPLLALDPDGGECVILHLTPSGMWLLVPGSWDPDTLTLTFADGSTLSNGETLTINGQVTLAIDGTVTPPPLDDWTI